jgi:hypothetical protein
MIKNGRTIKSSEPGKYKTEVNKIILSNSEIDHVQSNQGENKSHLTSKGELKKALDDLLESHMHATRKVSIN